MEWKAKLPARERAGSFRKELAATLALTCALILGNVCYGVPQAPTNPFGKPDPIQKKTEDVAKLEQSGNKSDYADALYDLATRYSNSGDMANARTNYERSLAVEQTLKRPDKELEVRTQIARTYLFQKQTEKALEKFNEAIDFARAHNVKGGITGTENNIAISLLAVGRVDEAEQHYTKALSECASDQFILRATVLRGLASVSRRRGKYDQAVKHLAEAAKLLGEHGDEGDQGAVLVELAQYQNISGDRTGSEATLEKIQKEFSPELFPDVLSYAEFASGENFYQRQWIHVARDHFEKAVKYAREDKANVELLVKCLIGLGVAEADLEHPKEAQAAHKEALEKAASINNLSQMIKAETQIANDYLIEGNPERALGHLKISLSRQTAADQQVRADVLAAIGACYAGLGQPVTAEKYYKDAATSFEELHDYEGKAQTLTSLAVLYLDGADYAKFDTVYAEAKQNYASLPPRTQAKLDYNYAQSLVYRNKMADALNVYEDALKKVVATGDEGMQSAVLRGLGLANFLSSNKEKALEYYLKALAMSKGSGSIETQWDCSLGVGKAYKALGRYPEAEPHLRNAVALVEQERSSMTRDSFKTFTLDLRKNCFQELVDLLVRTDRPYESLEIAERGKARAFLDMLANRKDHRIASIDSGGNTPGEKNAPVLVASSDSGTRSVTVSSRAENSFEETAISPVNADPPTISEMKSLVAKRKSTCVEYLLTNERVLYTWVVNPDGTIHMATPNVMPPDFQNRVRGLLTAMTRTPKTPSEMMEHSMKRQGELRNFYDLLVKPIEQFLPKDKDAVLTIIPHDVLFCIPYAALMNDKGEFLVEQHTLSYAPAIGVLRATQLLEQQSMQLPRKLLAFGNPITERIAFLGALPYAEKEVKHIAKLYPAGDSTIEIGQDATKAKFTELSPGASEIHLATHGLVDEEHPMKSALVLAPTDKDDGVLSVRDILTLKNLKARIVVLSACQTGRGKITGDGVVGLSRAFIIAGAPSVLVSQWNVDDIMTEFQMEKFYRVYLSGADRARALRDAQIATIKYMEAADDPNAPKVRANPRYWAAFQLIGEI